MEDRRGKGRVRLAFSQDTVKILQFARAAGGDDRNRDLFGNRPRQVKVKPILGPIGIHTRKKDLAGPQGHGFADPFKDVQSRCRPAAMDIDLPAAGCLLVL